MPQRRLLLLETHRLSAWRWHDGRLDAEQRFTADSAGNEAFARYLAANDKSIYSILVDVSEEGYQLEEVPYVRGRDRSALIKRRLGQYFYGTPFALAFSLGRQKAGRRDEKILFAALTQPHHLESWLAIMQTAEARLAGIFSAPQALAMLPAITKTPGQRLVLSITRNGGVRQTFFKDGKLHFSRLTALMTGTLEEGAIACAVEAQKIYQYLAGQRLITRNEALPVSILAHPSQFDAVRAHCKSTAELSFDFIDLVAEARKSRLKTLPQSSYCELLLLHNLVRRPPPQQFAPPVERRQFRLWQLSSGLIASAVVIFLACLLYAGKEYLTTRSLHESALELTQASRADELKYEAALKSLPPVPISNDDMRTLVTRFEELAKRSPRMEATLIPLSRALDASPGIEINSISWRTSAKLPTVTQQVSGVFKQPPFNISGSYYAIAEIDAQLPIALVNDHRAILEMINQFVAELGNEKSLGVQVMQLPFDVESGKTIKSSDAAAPGKVEGPKFSFRLVQGF